MKIDERTLTIVVDPSVLRMKVPCVEIQALSAKAVNLLVNAQWANMATIVHKPNCQLYHVALTDPAGKQNSYYRLRRIRPTVDFEIEEQP